MQELTWLVSDVYYLAAGDRSCGWPAAGCQSYLQNWLELLPQRVLAVLPAHSPTKTINITVYSKTLISQNGRELNYCISEIQ
jgi:hypothetical protein